MEDQYNCNGDSYVSHIRKLFEEYVQLQFEYSKLRQQFIENKILTKNGFHQLCENNKSIDDLRIELESEKCLTNSFNTEIKYLLEEIRKCQTRYRDLLTTIKLDRENQVPNVIEDGNKLELKLSQLEIENKELKENVEFSTSENCILSDSIKDLEETLLKERMEWLKEKERYEEVVVWSKGVYENSKTNKNRIDEMEIIIKENSKQIQLIDDFLSFLDNFIKSCPIDENIRKELNDNFNISDKENKIKIYENALQNLRAGNSDIDIKNNNHESKIVELYKDIDRLKENAKCLIAENDEMKNLLKHDSKFSMDEVNLKLENSKLTVKLNYTNEILEKLSQKYSRNRKVWKDNERKTTEEIEKLDHFIGTLINSLNTLPAELKTVPEVELILNMINESDNNIMSN